MILTIILMAVTCGATLTGQRFVSKYLKKHEKKAFPLGPLPEHSWRELKTHIIESAKGYYYADALLEGVLNQGHYFTCLQIYELRDIYQNKGWPNQAASRDHVDSLTCYKEVCKVDAKDRVFNLIHGVDESLLLGDKSDIL